MKEGGIKLGVQSYSFRRFTFERAVEIATELGLKYIEAYPTHLPPTNEGVKVSERLMKEYDVKIIAHGVNHMPRDEKLLNNLFKFAQKVGIEVLTADPDPESIDLLDKLVEEYGIAVAIHNHGPGHRYATTGDVLRVIEGHSDLIGMCLDTGHLSRAGEDILNAIERMGSRIYGVHLKDVNEKGEDVVIGCGVLDFESFFLRLQEKGLLHRPVIVIEYEPEPESPIMGIRRSLDYINKILARLG